MCSQDALHMPFKTLLGPFWDRWISILDPKMHPKSTKINPKTIIDVGMFQTLLHDCIFQAFLIQMNTSRGSKELGPRRN